MKNSLKILLEIGSAEDGERALRLKGQPFYNYNKQNRRNRKSII